MVVIDAKDLIVGRMGTRAAKLAMKGEKVDIVNCEQAIISGSKEDVLAKFKRKQDMGIPSKGPYQPKMPDRFVRKIIRGMLPYKQAKGTEAYKRIMCYIGIPEKLANAEKITFKECSISKLPNYKIMYVKDICKYLGGKVRV